MQMTALEVLKKGRLYFYCRRISDKKEVRVLIEDHSRRLFVGGRFIKVPLEDVRDGVYAVAITNPKNPQNYTNKSMYVRHLGGTWFGTACIRLYKTNLDDIYVLEAVEIHNMQSRVIQRDFISQERLDWIKKENYQYNQHPEFWRAKSSMGVWREWK